MTPADVVVVNDRGEIVDGSRKPSSETPLHTMVMRARPDIGAIVHTHSHYSTVVSCIRPYLPPILTETCLVAGATGAGDAVRADRDPRFRRERAGDPHPGLEGGDPQESRTDLLRGDRSTAALGIAEIVEESAKVYVHALAANGGREPDLVPEDLIPEMTERFLATYGQPKSS